MSTPFTLPFSRFFISILVITFVIFWVWAAWRSLKRRRRGGRVGKEEEEEEEAIEMTTIKRVVDAATEPHLIDFS